jgi:hypothetical protein
MNTLNVSLEEQDCNVVALDNNTGELVKAWDTSCKQGARYIDKDGNEQYLSTNCTLTDSAGYYYFSARVTEADGFETGKYYRLQFICNRKSDYGVFYVDVPKPTDVGKWFTFGRRYMGLIVLYIIALLAIAILVGLTWLVAGRSIAVLLLIILLLIGGWLVL